MQGFSQKGRARFPWSACGLGQQCCPSPRSMHGVYWEGIFGLCDPVQDTPHFCQGGGPIASGVRTGGASGVQHCPLSLLTSLLHCLILSFRGWTPKSLLPLSICGGGVIFVDAAFAVDRFKVGIWGPVLGGKVFHCSPFVKTPQEAALEALVRGICLCINIGWPVWRLAGDNPLLARCRRH